MNNEEENKLEIFSAIEQIINKLSPVYEQGVDSYIEYLNKKECWKDIEKKRVEYQFYNKIKEENIEKLLEWEKRSRKNFSEQEDIVISYARKIAEKIEEYEMKQIRHYISSNEYFRNTIKKKVVSIYDDLDTIKCRFLYLIYMTKIGKPISLKLNLSKK